MSEKNVDQIKALYTELSKLAPGQDWEKILKVAKKILGLSVTEKKAFQSKIVCLIHMDKFDEALTSIEKFPAEPEEFLFERAYCEYRLNKIEDAYNTLKRCKEMGSRENELLAQVTYRLEKFNESYDTYRDLIKNIDDDFDAERQTNMTAVLASLRTANKSSTKDLDLSEHENRTYELSYNSACVSIGKENYKEAYEKLLKAENMCKKTFEEEDQEFLDNELAIVRIQLGYCLQKLGKTDEALKLYNNVLKTKPSDIGATAVASNNIVCLNKDQNVFDSKKRLKSATATELEIKLNSFQRSLISFNEILFSIITNQKDSVSKLMEQFKNKFGDKMRYTLLKTSLLFKEKKFSECEKLLLEVVEDAKSSLIIRLYLVQVLLLQGKTNDAIDQLKKIDGFREYKLGIISAIIGLLKSKNEKEEISRLFADAINFHNKKNANNIHELEIYIRENSNFQISSGNLERACEMLEKMRSYRPKDFKILSKLINIYSKFDNAKAQKLSAELPSLDEVLADSNLDIDTLESQFTILNSKYGKSKAVITNEAKSPAAKVQTDLKKKKKRKGKLPKNYNPAIPIDTERWMPLRERSYYKGKRNKKKNAIGKGTQGAVSGKEPVSSNTSGPAQSPKPGVNSPESAPKPKLPASAQSKKKKKYGAKW